MSLNHLVRMIAGRPAAPKPSARRRASSWKPSVDALEGRLVLSQMGGMAAPQIAVAAQVQAAQVRASQRLNVGINVSDVNITQITRDATTGVLTIVGELTGTILGQEFTTPITGTLTPGRNPRVCPVLNLNIQPISLSVLGLNVNTSAICLNVSARRGGGLLGNLLCGGLNDVLSTASSTTLADPLGDATDQLNNLLSGNQLGGINSALGRTSARLLNFTPAQGNTAPVLNLAVGPVNLNLLGLRVKLDNCENGPVQVNITATQGGGLLGDLLFGLAGGNRRSVLRQVSGLLSQITNTVGTTV